MPLFGDGPPRIKAISTMAFAVFDGLYYRMREDLSNPDIIPWLVVGFEEHDPSDLRWIITQGEKWFWVKECFYESAGSYSRLIPRAFQRQSNPEFTMSYLDGERVGAVIEHLYNGSDKPDFYVTV